MMYMAWIPFVSPMNWMQSLWYLLLIPLALGISMIYKAMRVTEIHTYWRQVGSMTLQVVLAIAGLAIALILFVRYISPMA
jgi:cell division protein FtsW (lipid II flippase)